MDTAVVVDSDILIDYFAGLSPSAEAVQKLLETDLLAITTLTVFELDCGAQSDEAHRDIELLVQASRAILSLSTDAAHQAATQFRKLRRRVDLLDTPDLLIAGCCLAAGLPLLTRNTQHFERISELGLIDPQQILEQD